MSIEQQQQTIPQTLKAPPRYDRFFAAARKYNPLILNEVRRGLQDNIKEMLKVEASCSIYHGAENVRITLLLAASAVSIYLFIEGNRSKFPDNVPVMWNCIYLFFLLSGLAIFYVLGYLEARNFLTLVLPSSDKKHSGEDEMLIRFIESSSSNVDTKADEDCIRAKFVDENGNEIVPEKKSKKTSNAANGSHENQQQQEPEEEMKEQKENAKDDEEEEEEDEEELDEDTDNIMIPTNTKLECSIVDKVAFETVFKLNQKQNNNNNNSSTSKKSKTQDSPSLSSSVLSIPENVGLQFYSEVQLGEPTIVLVVELVVFRGALLRPTALKSCKATLAIEEFFSKEGVFYPPALRIEMRRIVKMLLASNGKTD